MKRFLKNLVVFVGYRISKINKLPLLNENPLKAIRSNLPNEHTVFFDIGANEGQTISKISKIHPDAHIYAFEPSKTCFNTLQSKFKWSRLNLYNVAMGANNGSLEFHEYSWSALNSVLKRAYGTATVNETYNVDVLTVDDFCSSNNIKHINYLKTDTEGYELQVLKGASRMMEQNKIQFVFVEILFNQHYIGQSSFGDIYNYLKQNHFELVRFYDVEYTKIGMASKTDALFINPNFIQ